MVSSPLGYVPQYDSSGSLIMREAKTESVNATASGNTELVAAVSGFKIRVIGAGNEPKERCDVDDIRVLGVSL